MTYKYVLENTPADISTLLERELRSRVRVLADVANKRIKRYESAMAAGRKPIFSYAYHGVQESGGKFSTAGKDINQLRAEYKRAYSYLTAETSTQEGARRVDKRVRERIGVGKDFDLSDFWKKYEHINRNYPKYSELFGSETIQQLLTDWITQGKDPELYADDIPDELGSDYADDADFLDELFPGNY